MTPQSPGGECFASHFPVVEMKNFATDDLVILMTLAGNQYQVAIARSERQVVNNLCCATPHV